MKKIITAILAVASLVCFTSCGSGTAICSFCEKEKSEKELRELSEAEGYICEECADFFTVDLDD